MEQYFQSFFKLKENEVRDYPPFENLHTTPQKAFQQQKERSPKELPEIESYPSSFSDSVESRRILLQKEKQQKQLKETIIGLYIGQIVGNIIGLCGEGRTKSEMNFLYKMSSDVSKHSNEKTKMKHIHKSERKESQNEISYETCVINHITAMYMNSDFVLNDWSCDIDQSVLLLDSLLANNGKVNVDDIAKRMKYWKHFGFTELGDIKGYGYGNTFRICVGHDKFLENPIETSENRWKKGLIPRDTDGSVMRTPFIVPFFFFNENFLIENVKIVGSITHPSFQCQAAVVVVSTILSRLLTNGEKMYENVDFDENHEMKDKQKSFSSELQDSSEKTINRKVIDKIIDEAFENGVLELEVGNKEQIENLKKHVYFNSLSELKLEKNVTFCMKPMACAIYALKRVEELENEGFGKKEIFRKCMEEIVMEGGDTDTNCGVAGSVIGAYLKGLCVPDEWLRIKHLKWIEEKIDRVLKMFGFDGYHWEKI